MIGASPPPFGPRRRHRQRGVLIGISVNGSGRAGYQEHVALPDRLEAADAAPVEPDALFKSMLPLHNPQAATFRTILPRLCGAPSSMSWALRASSSGSTVPTSVTSFPLSNSSAILFSRAVVTST